MFRAHHVIQLMAALFVAIVMVIPVSGKAAQGIRPEVVEQVGISPYDVVISASLRLVAYPSANGVAIFDLSTGLLLRQVSGDNQVTSLAISTQDRYLAIGTKYSLKVIDLITNENLVSLDAEVRGLKFSGDSQWLTVVTKLGVFQIPTTLRKIAPELAMTAGNIGQLGGRGVETPCNGYNISVSDDGQQFVCKGDMKDRQNDRSPVLYDWKLIDLSSGRSRIIQDANAAAITPDGHSVLAIFREEKKAKLYDVADPRKVQEEPLVPEPHLGMPSDYFPYHAKSINAYQKLAFRGNNEAIWLEAHMAYRLDLKPFRSTKIDSSMVTPYFDYQKPIGMDPGGRILLLSGNTSILDRFVSGAEPVFKLLDVDALDQPPFRTIYGTITWSGKSHDGRFFAQATPQGLLLAQRFRDRARVTNLTTGAVVYDYAGLHSIGEQLGVMAMVDPAGRKAYFGRDNGTLEERAIRDRLEKKAKGWVSDEVVDVELKKIREHVLVDLTTGRQIPIQTDMDSIDAIFSPHGNYLLVTGKRDFPTLVSTNDGKVLHQWGESMSRAIERCSFSDDEKRLHCAGRVVSIPDGKLLLDATNQNDKWLEWIVRTAKMSPDGRWLAYYENQENKAHVLSVQTGKEVMVKKVDYLYTGSFSWSPDNRLVLPNKYEKPSITIVQFSELGSVEKTTLQIYGCDLPNLTVLGTIFCKNNSKVYDQKTGQRRGDSTQHVGDYATPQEGRHLLVDTPNGQSLLDLKTGETLANISVGADDWAITLPEGYYTAPRGVNKLIGIRKGNHVYSFDEFDLTLNRPDLVRERLGAPKSLVKALKRAQAKRAQRFGVIDESMRPTVEIDYRSLPLLTSDAQIKVAFSAEAVKGARLTSAQVYVNGVPTLGRDGVAVTPGANGKVSQQLPVELIPGSNRIQVSVFDDKGTESLRDTGVVTRKAAPAPITRYVLAVGVSKYQDASLNLDYAAKDATDLAAVLQRSSPGIARTVVKTLTDAEVTRDKLREARQFFAEAKPQDQAIVFIAGHGVLDDKDDYYFAGHDINASNPSSNGVPLGDIEDLFSDTQSRRRLLLMDTCHSGEVDHDMEQKLAALPQGVSGTRALKLKSDAPQATSAESMDSSTTTAFVTELFADLRRGVGATALASASGIELAQESAQFKNGLFTSALLEALSNQSTDTDGSLSIEMSELRDRVAARVRALSNGTQSPSTRVENYDENLLLSAWTEAQVNKGKEPASAPKGKKKK